MTVAEYIDQSQRAERSNLVDGFNHVAQVTQDLDRLAAFYRDVFEVPFIELPDPRGRHGFLLFGANPRKGELGPVLHVFEVPEEARGSFGSPDAMFHRGRLDHIAIQAADEHTLAELRDRLVASGACDGVVRAFGSQLLSLHVVDPEGMRLEVVCAWSRVRFGDDDVVPAH